MIPKNKIEEACDQCCNFGLGLKVHNDTLKRSLFKAGVTFAEKELENLAIEFAKWLSWNCWKKILVENSNDWGHITGNTKTTQELFEIFKKEKYGTESN